MLHRLYDTVKRGELRFPQYMWDTGTADAHAYAEVLAKTAPTAGASGFAVQCEWVDVTNGKRYLNTGTTTSAVWTEAGAIGSSGFLPIPLTSLREVVSNDIYNIAGFGSLLCKDTTPNLEYTNGDTDSCLRLDWAAGQQDPIVFQTPLPPTLDTASDVVVHFRAAMGGATNTPVIAADSYFNEGDTKVEDNSGAVTGTSYAEYTITVAAADVPSGAQTMTCELTPGAHAADALYMSAIWLEFSTTAA